MKRSLAILSLGLLFAPPTGAQTLDRQGYRVGEPAVLAPPPVHRPDHGAAFARAWRRGGSPRIAVLWNQELSDEVATRYSERTVVDHSSTSHATARVLPGGMGVEASGSVSGRTAVESGVARVEPNIGTGPPEDVRWGFESAFTGAFSDAGVKLVSRAAAMRRQSVSDGVRTPNLQAIEMKALRSHADYVLELLMTPSTTGGGNYLYRVRVTQIASARVVADLTTGAARAASPVTDYVATSRGFEPATPAPQTMAETGRELAHQTMVALTEAFRRR